MGTFNFGYDIIYKRKLQSPNDVAVRWHTTDGKILEISNDDLHHHSDVTAFYLKRLGVEPNSRVFLYDLEKTFELTTVLTALHKLCATPVFDTQNQPETRCNELNAYMVIAKNDSFAIERINQNIDKFKTLEIKLSVGYPYPKYWFDLHTGVRLSGIFKPKSNNLKSYNSIAIYNSAPVFYNENYPLTSTHNYIWNRFYRAMIKNEVFEF